MATSQSSTICWERDRRSRFAIPSTCDNTSSGTNNDTMVRPGHDRFGFFVLLMGQKVTQGEGGCQ